MKTLLQKHAQKILDTMEAQKPLEAYDIMSLERTLHLAEPKERDQHLRTVLRNIINRYYNGISLGLIILDLSVALNFSLYGTMPEDSWDRLREIYNP